MLGDVVRTYSNVRLNVVVTCIDRRETSKYMVIDKRYFSKLYRAYLVRSGTRTHNLRDNT